jgi:hypothetical protein
LRSGRKNGNRRLRAGCDDGRLRTEVPTYAEIKTQLEVDRFDSPEFTDFLRKQSGVALLQLIRNRCGENKAIDREVFFQSCQYRVKNPESQPFLFLSFLDDLAVSPLPVRRNKKIAPESFPRRIPRNVIAIPVGDDRIRRHFERSRSPLPIQFDVDAKIGKERPIGGTSSGAPVILAPHDVAGAIKRQRDQDPHLTVGTNKNRWRVAVDFSFKSRRRGSDPEAVEHGQRCDPPNPHGEDLRLHVDISINHAANVKIHDL